MCSRERSINFLARPKRLYERSTDIELTCPWMTSSFFSSSESSSLYRTDRQRCTSKQGKQDRRSNVHLGKYVSNNASFMIFCYERDLGPGHRMVHPCNINHIGERTSSSDESTNRISWHNFLAGSVGSWPAYPSDPLPILTWTGGQL
jgi:hypothetical protein